MDWRDTGILLTVRRHGESSAVIEVFSAEHGRHAGVVRGATSRRLAPALQPGTELDLAWRARLEDHLGTYQIEPRRALGAAALGDRLSLAGLNALLALLAFTLPEREAHPDLYARTLTLMDLLDRPDIWPLAYLRWEMALLDEMGFGLDLSACAVRGVNEDLAFVSPRTGRAVSREGAGVWADRLLPLPPVLRGAGEGADPEVWDGLRTTGHFLAHHLAPSLGERPMPPARALFLDRFARRLPARGDPR